MRNEEEEKGAIADARRLALEAEAQMGVALAALDRMRSAISAVEEENRELRAHVARTNVQIYTEREFATLCKVSTATIVRARRAGKIRPLMIGSLVRYSSAEHVAKLPEIFGAPAVKHRVRTPAPHGGATSASRG